MRVTTLYIAPSSFNVGLTSVCLGLVRSLERLGVRVAYFKPIAQSASDVTGPELSTQYIRATTALEPPLPIDADHAKLLLSRGDKDQLLEEVVGLYRHVAKKVDVVIVEGLITTTRDQFGPRLNIELVKCLDAEVILAASPVGMSITEFSHRLETTERLFSQKIPKVLGAIVNNVNAPEDLNFILEPMQADISDGQLTAEIFQKDCKVFNRPDFKLIGFIPWQRELLAPRMQNVIEFMQAKKLNAGQLDERRVSNIVIGAAQPAVICDNLQPGSLLVVPGGREDLIITGAMAALNGVPLAGILLTDSQVPAPSILHFCEKAMTTGLPVLIVDQPMYLAVQKLTEINRSIPVDDIERLEKVTEAMASDIQAEWLKDHCAITREPRLSPPAFRYQLVEQAKIAQKRIVLPEGDEPRTIQAAAICEQRGIAKCVLLGSAQHVQHVAQANAIELPESIEIIDPKHAKGLYIQALVEKRKHKGLTAAMAEAMLDDTIMVGTMMLANGEVDGLVAGALNTTANTIRPALQIIKTKPESKVVSSVFFMCLPEQVVAYGDCAVNPNPTAEQLADIALQSAASAKAFGITPRVAMISYSTGSSGQGSDVEKVAEATKIAKSKASDLLIDGPLQYDAAAIESVGSKKAPNSPVAGKATVFIFPDLNTGNTTYKAVQRSADVVSIGPMLQGLQKPVNDLSRGASVEDIVYTIALTCIQAQSQ